MHVVFALLCIAPTALIIGWLIYSGKRTSRIEKQGVPGTAQVLGVFDQENPHGPPIVRFHCRVSPGDHGLPFEGDTSPFVSRTVSTSLYVGQTVAVRMNPRKRTEFYIVGDGNVFYADAEHP